MTSLQQSAEQNLARFAARYQVATGARGRVAFSNWEEAFSALLSLGEGAKTPVLVVVDEFPYLLVSNPEIPSLLQALLSPRGVPARQPPHEARAVQVGIVNHAWASHRNRPSAGAGLARAHGSPVVLSRGGRLLGHRRRPEVVGDAARSGRRKPAYLDMSGTSGPGAVGELDDWVVSALLNPGIGDVSGGQYPVGPRTRSHGHGGLSLHARSD